MFGLVRPAVRALGLTTTFAVVTGAQDAKECEVNESRPAALGRASLAVMTAAQSQSPDAARRQLTNAMRQLNGIDDRSDNQAGRSFVLGKALVVWSMQPGIGLESTRGAVGLGGAATAPLDVATTIDSLFRVVETAMPECVSETVKWRGQKPWIDLVNKAIEKLSMDEADSAAWAAQRAITLNPFAPYGYVVLANVRQREQKSSEAFALYRKSVELAEKDSTFDEIRRQALVYMGTLAVDSAEMASDAATRQPYVEQARAAFEAILADKGASAQAPNARNGLCRVAIASGDTASLRTTYADPLSTPGSFDYNELMNAGVCMARAEMVPEAAFLFQSAHEKNGYHRDVLANLAILLLRQDKNDEALPHVLRLVSVEPNNPENLQLLVLSYAGIAQRLRAIRTASAAAAPAATKTAAKTPATKATGAKTSTTKAPAGAAPAARLSQAASDSIFKLEQAYTDSAVTANSMRDSLPVRVSISDFSITPEKASMQGSLTLSSTVKAPEGEYTIKVDFLDATGSVVASQESKMPVTADRTGRFRVEAAGSSIGAFRYQVVAP